MVCSDVFVTETAKFDSGYYLIQTYNSLDRAEQSEYRKYILEGIASENQQIFDKVLRSACNHFNRSGIQYSEMELYIEKFIQSLLTQMEKT